jgi:hypothetical protein
MCLLFGPSGVKQREATTDGRRVPLNSVELQPPQITGADSLDMSENMHLRNLHGKKLPLIALSGGVWGVELLRDVVAGGKDWTLQSGSN